ncbi:MAG: hypothetical protein MHPSP_004486 [Paramarteilia canceri]
MGALLSVVSRNSASKRKKPKREDELEESHQTESYQPPNQQTHHSDDEQVLISKIELQERSGLVGAMDSFIFTSPKSKKNNTKSKKKSNL